MKCELCKENDLDIFTTEIVFFSKNIEKWSYKICSKCSQTVDEYFSSKAYEAINNLIKKRTGLKNV